LTLPRKTAAALGLTREASVEAILADGRTVELDLFVCFFDWFGKTYETQVTASDAEYPLLGTMLLDGRRLEVDYAEKTVELK
jgi:predicted aspartyl protease